MQRNIAATLLKNFTQATAFANLLSTFIFCADFPQYAELRRQHILCSHVIYFPGLLHFYSTNDKVYEQLIEGVNEWANA